MKRRDAALLFVSFLTVGLIGLPGCASQPKKTRTEASEDGPTNLSQALADSLVGKPEADLAALVGHLPKETKALEDGRTLWVYAWARVTLNAETKALISTEIKTLSIWIKAGVADEAKFVQSP